MLPQSAADYLTAVGQTALEAKQRLDAMVPSAEAGFPALWTDYDVSTGRCTWVEQWFDADNQRATKPRGRSGSPTNMPAYPVGGGVIPDFAEAGSGSGSGTVSGVEVWLRPRICRQGQGQAHEFDWPDSGGGGGGSVSGVLAGIASITLTAGSSGSIDISLPSTLGNYLVHVGVSGNVQINSGSAVSSGVSCTVTGTGGVGTPTPTAFTFVAAAAPSGTFGSDVIEYGCFSCTIVATQITGTDTVTLSLLESGSGSGRTASLFATLSAVGPVDFS
jgi:hypothetical protein